MLLIISWTVVISVILFIFYAVGESENAFLRILDGIRIMVCVVLFGLAFFSAFVGVLLAFTYVFRYYFPL